MLLQYHRKPGQVVYGCKCNATLKHDCFHTFLDCLLSMETGRGEMKIRVILHFAEGNNVTICHS